MPQSKTGFGSNRVVQIHRNMTDCVLEFFNHFKILRLSRIFELSFHPYICKDVFIPNDVKQLIFILL